MLYRDSGVDIDKGDSLVDFLKKIIKLKPENIGPFAAIVDLKVLKEYSEPVLVASTDGIGTKIDLAIQWGKLEGLGYDLFAMCANDIGVYGAKPLFFLDYYATGHLDLEVSKSVLRSLVEACESFNCPLVGGETAELPGLLEKGKFDIAGFIVGVQEKSKLPNPSRVKPGDLLLGLPSTGVHSNGYSLVRAIIEKCGLQADYKLGDGTLREILLKPTRIYVGLAEEVFREFDIKGAAHITGGGIPGNLSRVIPKDCDAVIDKSSWEVPEIFKFLQEKGEVPDGEMWRVFNMGIGFIFIVSKDELKDLAQFLQNKGESYYIIGKIAKGSGKLVLK